MLALGSVIVGIGNPIVASTKKQYVELRETYFEGRRANFSIGDEGLWLRQGDAMGQTVIRAARSNLDGTVLFDVTLMSYRDVGGPNQRIEADTARLETGRWVLRNATVWPIISGENPQFLAQNVRQFDVPSNLTLEQIRDRIGNPSSISIWDLPAYIARLETAGFSARRHSVWLHMEIARPLFLVGMLLIGASFTMRHVRFGGTGQALIVSVVFGFGLYYVRNFAQILGETGQIPILFAAYAPPLATILLAMGIILHMEDG
jgi:lipopolysaccharide export system permease protein